MRKILQLLALFFWISAVRSAQSLQPQSLRRQLQRHDRSHSHSQTSATTAAAATGLDAAGTDTQLPDRRLLVVEFSGAPSLEEKEAEAATILAQRPDNLLRNLKVKDQERVQMFPEGCAVSESTTSKRLKVLADGAANTQQTAGGCADSCKETKTCNAWLWCNDEAGCETETGMQLAFHACQLQLQRPMFPIVPPTNWNIAKFVAGFDGAAGPKKAVPPEQRAAVIAPMTADRCPLAYGLLSLKQAFLNKHDYARLHNFELLAHPVAKNPVAPGSTWYRMQLIHQALQDVPPERAGWILFMDQDVLIDEMAFKIPFKQYAGKDLVMWGSRKLVSEDAYQSLLSVSHKDRQQGIDTGVMLIRNSEWSRALVSEVLAFMTDPGKQATLKSALKTYEPLLFEQNALALLLRDLDRLNRTVFESEYCINCAWAHGLQGRLPFIKRFSECSFCTGFRNSREQMYECTSELVKTYAFSNRMALGILGCGQNGGKSDLIQPSDPGPRSRSDGSSSAVITQHLQLATQEASGPNPVLAFASFLKTHFFTMAFLCVFFASFLHRRRR